MITLPKLIHYYWLHTALMLCESVGLWYLILKLQAQASVSTQSYEKVKVQVPYAYPPKALKYLKSKGILHVPFISWASHNTILPLSSILLSAFSSSFFYYNLFSEFHTVIHLLLVILTGAPNVSKASGWYFVQRSSSKIDDFPFVASFFLCFFLF